MKWTQKLINERPDLLDEQIKKIFRLNQSEGIEWVSPLKEDKYAEYRDADFLERLGITLDKKSLKEFWPKRGPQWDALGRSIKGKYFLVEAKAHVEEVVSPPTLAKGGSLKKIQSSLQETKTYVNSNSPADWSSFFYQYTNRLAHLYLLRVLNSVPAFLVFIYFLNDRQMNGPETEPEWKAALTVMHKYLGIKRNKLAKYVGDVFVDVNDV